MSGGSYNNESERDEENIHLNLVSENLGRSKLYLSFIEK